MPLRLTLMINRHYLLAWPRCLQSSCLYQIQYIQYRHLVYVLRCYVAWQFSCYKCWHVARRTANCGGEINLASGGHHTLKSPGYDNHRYYLSYQGCSWWIKVFTVLLLLLLLDS